jgi:hypothetical protein
MRNRFSLLVSAAALAALCIFPPSRAAAVIPPPAAMAKYMTPATSPVLTASPINVACASDVGNTNSPLCSSFTIDTRGYKSIQLVIRYVYSSASVVSLYKDDSVVIGSGSGSLPWGVLQIGDASSAPRVLEGAQETYWSVSASATWSVGFDVTAPFTRFRFVGTGAAAGDTVTVYAVLIGG